jgi:hypothetical protein
MLTPAKVLIIFVLWMLLVPAALLGGCAQLPGRAGVVQARVEGEIIDAAGSYCERLSPAERGASCDRFNARLGQEKGAKAIIICKGDKFPVEGAECVKR